MTTLLQRVGQPDFARRGAAFCWTGPPRARRTHTDPCNLTHPVTAAAPAGAHIQRMQTNLLDKLRTIGNRMTTAWPDLAVELAALERAKDLTLRAYTLGEGPASLLERAVVVYERAPDFTRGEQPGARLACGVIRR